ncbi:MAG: TIGR04076 family protein [Candidatus Thorarchaeota archaeon]
MTKYKVKIEVIDILGEGNCSMDQKVGDTYNYPEDRGEMCPSSFYTLYPWIMVMLSGGRFTDEGDGSDFMTSGCPDYKHQVVYKISRTPAEEQ